MRKRLEPLANVAILIACLIVSVFVIREQVLVRETVRPTATQRTLVPLTPDPLAGLVSERALSPISGSHDMAVATLFGRAITGEQLDAAMGFRTLAIRSQEYRVKRSFLDQAIDRYLLEQEASQRNTSLEELARDEIVGRTAPVTEADIQLVYENSAERLANVRPADARKFLSSELLQTRLLERRRQFVRELRDKADVQVLMAPPRAPVNPGLTPSRGPADAPIQIVEFADFQCPFCASNQIVLRALQQRYPGQIRLAFRHFPLPMHADAPLAAQAVECAGEQQRFWQMHDLLFKRQPLTAADLSPLAKEALLDVDQFSSCLATQKYEARWRRDKSEGERYGVTATPTYFVNGRLLTGAQSLEAFSAVIDEELNRLRARPDSDANVIP